MSLTEGEKRINERFFTENILKPIYPFWIWKQYDLLYFIRDNKFVILTIHNLVKLYNIVGEEWFKENTIIELSNEKHT